MKTEVQPQETKVLVKRLKTRGRILQYAMTLLKSKSANQLPEESWLL